MIEFKGTNFEDFKFKRSTKFTEEFYNELIDEGSEISKDKFRRSLDEEVKEQVHIKVSYTFLFALITISTAIIALTNAFMSQMFITSYILLGLSFVNYLLFKRNVRQANNLQDSKKMCNELVNVVFNKE